MELHCSPASPQKPVIQLCPIKKAEPYPWQIEARWTRTDACAVVMLMWPSLTVLHYTLEEDIMEEAVLRNSDDSWMGLLSGGLSIPSPPMFPKNFRLMLLLHFNTVQTIFTHPLIQAQVPHHPLRIRVAGSLSWLFSQWFLKLILHVGQLILGSCEDQLRSPGWKKGKGCSAGRHVTPRNQVHQCLCRDGPKCLLAGNETWAPVKKLETVQGTEGGERDKLFEQWALSLLFSPGNLLSVCFSQPVWVMALSGRRGWQNLWATYIVLPLALVCFFIAVIKHWPKASWGGKDLFQLISYSPSLEESKAETWSLTLAYGGVNPLQLWAVDLSPLSCFFQVLWSLEKKMTNTGSQLPSGEYKFVLGPIYRYGYTFLFNILYREFLRWLTENLIQQRFIRN